MDTLQKSVLTLLRSGLTDTPCTIDGLADWEQIYQIADYHEVVSLIHRAVRISRTDVPKDIMTRIQAGFINEVRINRFQTAELRNIFGAFEKNGIDYIPLKGVVMKSLYPRPEYRQMSDADIIIKKAQYDTITDIMNRAGYTYEYMSDYELTWKKSFFTVEFHSDVISYIVKDSLDYFGNAFQNAVPADSPHRYRMNDLDEIVYSVSHLAKHFINGGTRLRSIMDFHYLFQRTNVDEEELLKTLKKINLCHFYDIVKRTVASWFEDLPMDPDCELLISNAFSESRDFFLSRGSNYLVAQANRGKTDSSGTAKTGTFFKMIFLPYRYMKIRFPILNKLPFLLPFLWVWRCISALLFHRDIMKKMFRINAGNSSVKDGYMNELKTMGLENAVFPEDL